MLMSSTHKLLEKGSCHKCFSMVKAVVVRETRTLQGVCSRQVWKGNLRCWPWLSPHEGQRSLLVRQSKGEGHRSLLSNCTTHDCRSDINNSIGCIWLILYVLVTANSTMHGIMCILVKHVKTIHTSILLHFYVWLKAIWIHISIPYLDFGYELFKAILSNIPDLSVNQGVAVHTHIWLQ